MNQAFPEPFEGLVNVVSKWTSFDFANQVGLPCLKGAGFDNYYALVIVSSLIPIGIIMALWVVYFLSKAIIEKSEIPKAFASYLNVTLLISYLVLPTVSMLQAGTLVCQKLHSEDTPFLRVQTIRECADPVYSAPAFNVILPLIVFYQSIPLLYLALLQNVRDLLNVKQKEAATEAASGGTRKLRSDRLSKVNPRLTPIKFLITSYKPSCFYFDTVDLYRRIVYIAVLPGGH